MHFSTDIDLGNLIAAGAMIITLFGLHQQNIKRLHKIEFRVDLMWRGFVRRFNQMNDEERQALDDMDG